MPLSEKIPVDKNPAQTCSYIQQPVLIHINRKKGIKSNTSPYLPDIAAFR